MTTVTTNRAPAQRRPQAAPDASFWQRLRYFLNPFDGRYGDLTQGPWRLNVLRDFTAGLIVAMVAIPMAMGLAMASGLPPQMGIVGGAMAGLVGALFGGSKYQVYGPTAAFIPVILAITTKYGGTPEAPNYDFLIWCSILSGIVLIGMGLGRLGRIVALVPNSIVVGFTIGIAVVIAMSQIEQVLGLKAKLSYGFFSKMRGIAEHIGEANLYAVLIAALTFAVIKLVLKVSKYAPAPLIALGLATLLSSTLFADQGLARIIDKYGPIPDNLVRLTFPGALEVTPHLLLDMLYFVIAIVFVSGVESLLCSRMADRLAENRGTPYNPNKELWGQGWVQIVVVLFNGFPHTGALARTATNIKVGALSPLAGIFKFALKLLLAIFLARWLEIVPMACIGGILMFVAFNMVNSAEVREVWRHSRFDAGMMIYTAVLVVMTDFLVGVLSALVLYWILGRLRGWATRPVEDQPARRLDKDHRVPLTLIVPGDVSGEKTVSL